ncbi:hypothetical protein HYX14_02575 [Candidatus Woesearchaeota archaeon]|nr:hypothetical protein [Candidatus Woesearchaeota archaeon]
MTSPLHYLTQGTRILASSLKSRIAPKHYFGDADTICKEVVSDCWNGKYFQTSTTNFPQFWTRDFGWCTQSLMKLGHEEKVHHTLRFALNNFQQHHAITTTQTPGGKPFDFPTFAVDSLPWLIHSIKISKFPYYIYKDFLNQQIQIYHKKFIRPATGLVDPDLHFSSIKDFAVRKSSCYDNCMAGLLAHDLQEMKLINPFKHDPEKILMKYFWNGNYFYDDLHKKEYVAGDANLFPFVSGIIRDAVMVKSSFAQIQAAGLDQPFPLKYTAIRQQINFIPQEILMHNYESNAIWTHLGLFYIKLLKQIDSKKAAEHKEQYRQLIEKHQNFLEVFTADGQPYSSPFYVCDRGMLWAANYVTL